MGSFGVKSRSKMGSFGAIEPVVNSRVVSSSQLVFNSCRRCGPSNSKWPSSIHQENGRLKDSDSSSA
jgi:hypothetical protein